MISRFGPWLYIFVLTAMRAQRAPELERHNRILARGRPAVWPNLHWYWIALESNNSLSDGLGTWQRGGFEPPRTCCGDCRLRHS